MSELVPITGSAGGREMNDQPSRHSPIPYRNFIPSGLPDDESSENAASPTTPKINRLSLDSGLPCGGECGGEEEEDDGYRRRESVGGESGYGSPFVTDQPPPAELSSDYLRSTLNENRSAITADSMVINSRRVEHYIASAPSSSRQLYGAYLSSSRWTIQHPHKKVMAHGPFDPPSPEVDPEASNSFRSIGTQTNDFDREINLQQDVVDIDEDNLDDAFLDDVEEVENNGHRVLHTVGDLPDVVPSTSAAGDSRSRTPSGSNNSSGGRSRAHSVSLPVSHLDFSEPIVIGQCLSLIASTIDEEIRCGAPSTRQTTNQIVQRQQPLSSRQSEGNGGIFAYLPSSVTARVRRQRSQSASEADAPSSWTNSVPKSRNVATATNAPPTGAFGHSSTTKRDDDKVL